MASVVYRQYTGETDLPHIISLVEHELSEPYVIYTYRYFLNQWCVSPFSPPPDQKTHPASHRPHLSFLVSPVPDLSCRFVVSSHLCANVPWTLVPQAYPDDGSEVPIGCIVCKQSPHRESRNRGYIAMLSVHKNWRKRGIGRRSSDHIPASCSHLSCGSHITHPTVGREHETKWCPRSEQIDLYTHSTREINMFRVLGCARDRVR